jgi:hypothetical protein
MRTTKGIAKTNANPKMSQALIQLPDYRGYRGLPLRNIFFVSYRSS